MRADAEQLPPRLACAGQRLIEKPRREPLVRRAGWARQGVARASQIWVAGLFRRRFARLVRGGLFFDLAELRKSPLVRRRWLAERDLECLLLAGAIDFECHPAADGQRLHDLAHIGGRMDRRVVHLRDQIVFLQAAVLRGPGGFDFDDLHPGPVLLLVVADDAEIARVGSGS